MDKKKELAVVYETMIKGNCVHNVFYSKKRDHTLKLA
jgi:hypothetical protein